MCGCAIVLAATTALAGEADRIRRDTPYADARKALLADGFLPARTGACRAPGREDICTKRKCVPAPDLPSASLLFAGRMAQPSASSREAKRSKISSYIG